MASIQKILQAASKARETDMERCKNSGLPKPDPYNKFLNQSRQLQ